MKLESESRSLAEVHGSVAIPHGASWVRRMFAFAGPAYLVSVGYMDPGNWATDLAGGAKFGYQLVWVLVMSNLIAVLLQTLSARLGVVTGKDLAQACRDYYPTFLTLPLWILCEIAIIACDLAEVLGAAIGLQLLFGLPLLWGVFLTGLDVLLLLALSRLGMRRLEALILTLVATIGGCFAIEMLLSRPDVASILAHVVPRDLAGHASLFGHDGKGATVLGLNGESLYVAMGILGATVMPHNLYLHSALVQSRAVGDSEEGKQHACRMNLIDTAVALNAALFVNGAILVLAGTVFHTSGHQGVASLHEAHRLLAPLLGTSLASTLFAVALLSSGQSSTITGTLAGQIVMEGFLKIRIRPWLRRLISRGLAIVPAALVILWRGAQGADALLVLSQVILSLQLSFAVVPLIAFTSDRSRMGTFANPKWVVVLASLAAAVILGLNAKLVVDTLGVWMAAGGAGAVWVKLVVVPAVVAVAALLLVVLLMPFRTAFAPRWMQGGTSGAPAAAGARGPSAAVLEAAVAAAPVAPPLIPAADARWKRVAVALELGAADPPVLDHVRALPLPPGGEVVLLHVAESAASRYLGAESSDLERREDQQQLEAHAAMLRATGKTVRVQLGFGDAKAELTRMTNEAGADLLITGSHGHGFVGDLLYGSTVSALRHQVRCPVLTIRPHTGWRSFRAPRPDEKR